MDKLPICRICLVENVNLYVVVNKNLHELYEKLTDIPFVTKERSRPVLACFFCCAKLKQCFRFLRKCLEGEELFAQMMNGNYEPNPLISHDDLTCCTGFVISPTVHVSIVDECETDSIVIKDVPAIFERQDERNELNEEYQSDDSTDVDPENLNNTCLGREDIDSDGDVIIELEEEQELTKNKRRAVETNNVDLENLNNTCLGREDIDSDGDDIIEVEDKQEETKKKRRAVETNNSTDVDLENLNNTCLGREDIDSDGDDIIEVEDKQEETKKKRRAVETNKAKKDKRKGKKTTLWPSVARKKRPRVKGRFIKANKQNIAATMTMSESCSADISISTASKCRQDPT